MTKADTIFKKNIERILKDGVFSEQARPKYKDGTVANSKYVTGAFSEYDLAKGNSHHNLASYRHQISYQRSSLESTKTSLIT